MDLDIFRKEYCPILKAMDQIGDKWSMLIMRECFLGTRRFEDFYDHLGISKSVLSGKLKKMVDQGLLKKTPYQNEGERTRYEYRLTQKSRDFRKVLIGLLSWSNKYLVEEGNETMYILDSNDNPVHLEVVDDELNSVPLRETRMVIKSKSGDRPSFV
ncbi:MAG: helix-turn-helix transcriptional regulator [Saprospiraceae bacterium]|nr:helix-turn-helix transcriptional regulator [Saprospiraceae bacterium]